MKPRLKMRVTLFWLLGVSAFAAAQDGGPPPAMKPFDEGLPHLKGMPCVDGCLNHPKVEFQIDFLAIERSGVDSQPILVDGGGATILDGSQIDSPWRGGMRLDFIMYDYQDQFLDQHLGYMQLEKATDYQTATAAGAQFRFFGGVAANPRDTYTVRYSSKLASGEINARRRVGERLTLAAGLRILELREDYDIYTAPRTGVFAKSDNDLYGGQISLNALLWTNGISRLEATAKAGVYYNDIRVYATAANVQNRWRDDEASFLGEAGVALVIPAWPFNLRIGYQVMWMTNVALAPDQSDSLNIFSGAGAIDTSTPMFHGGFVGFEFVH